MVAVPELERKGTEMIPNYLSTKTEAAGGEPRCFERHEVRLACAPSRCSRACVYVRVCARAKFSLRVCVLASCVCACIQYARIVL